MGVTPASLMLATEKAQRKDPNSVVCDLNHILLSSAYQRHSLVIVQSPIIPFYRVGKSLIKYE
jgi:hypothetical protein